MFPDARLLGLAGPRMAAASVEPIVDFDRLVVMGLAEIFTRLPFFVSVRRKIRQLLRNEPPDLVIPVDYPGFNLWLCEEAHRLGIPVLYYIAPQLWAWRPGRARVLAATTDRVAVVFRQEEPFLRKFGVEAVFVGHPLLDHLGEQETRGEAIAALGADPERPILGLLPGSRPQEARRHMRPFIQVADEVRRRRPDVQVFVSSAPHVPAQSYQLARDYPVVADSARILSAATVVLTKSGTTTIEAALRETPMVIAHRVNPLTYLVARRLVRVDAVGMVNLLARRRVVSEFVQHLPVDAISSELCLLLDVAAPQRQAMLEALRGVRSQLGEPGAPRRVAKLAADLLNAA